MLSVDRFVHVKCGAPADAQTIQGQGGYRSTSYVCTLCHVIVSKQEIQKVETQTDLFNE